MDTPEVLFVVPVLLVPDDILLSFVPSLSVAPSVVDASVVLLSELPPSVDAGSNSDVHPVKVAVRIRAVARRLVQDVFSIGSLLVGEGADGHDKMRAVRIFVRTRHDFLQALLGRHAIRVIAA